MAQAVGRPKGSTITAKKRLFAKLVAAGTAKIDAYDAVYAKMAKRTSKKVAASNLSNQPEVKALIEEGAREIIPIDITNIRRERLQNLGTIKGLSLTAEDTRVRLAAAVKLDEILADWEEKLNVRPTLTAGAQVEALVSELLRLSGQQDKPAIEMEVVSESEATTAAAAMVSDSAADIDAPEE